MPAIGVRGDELGLVDDPVDFFVGGREAQIGRERPPFGIERGELDALLLPHFELIEDREVSGSIPVFAGRERWLTWRPRGLVILPAQPWNAIW